MRQDQELPSVCRPLQERRYLATILNFNPNCAMRKHFQRFYQFGSWKLQDKPRKLVECIMMSSGRHSETGPPPAPAFGGLAVRSLLFFPFTGQRLSLVTLVLPDLSGIGSPKRTTMLSRRVI